MFLFIDTTQDITLGLLDKDCSWKSYQFFENVKGSAVIHKYIYDVLKEHDVALRSIEGIIQIAGPGSYTGMRVSDGLSQIFDWEGFKTYSFYHYDVPRFLDKDKGIWISNAFKGEYFVFEWDEKNTKSSLVKAQEMEAVLKSTPEIYSSFLVKGIDMDIKFTSKLIYKNSSKLFSKIVAEEMKSPLYYYRTVEEEYKR